MGLNAPAVSVINFLGTRSNISTTYTSARICPSGVLVRESNAILVLSGDQYGLSATRLLRFVSCTTFSPSGSLIHISGGPLRLELKAICLPSGEYRGQD